MWGGIGIYSIVPSRTALAKVLLNLSMIFPRVAEETARLWKMPLCSELAFQLIFQIGFKTLRTVKRHCVTHFLYIFKHRSCFHFFSLPLLLSVISSSPQWSSCVPLSERSRRNALAQRLETSWIPQCGLCRKALSLRDGAAPGFHGKADKQEETLRESRSFTALDHYKHPERGRKPLLILK